jgi:hypothetical protein
VAFEPITAVEILAGKFAKTSIFSKIRNSLDFLNGALGSLGVVDVPNGSFEVDSGGTGVPDNWTLSTYPGGSGSTDTVTPAHGAKGIKLVHPGGVGNGGGYWESDYIPCSPQAPQVIGVIHHASAAGMKNQVIIRHFTEAKTTISDETVYSSTTNPTASTQLLMGFTPPATGRFYKIKLVGGYTDTNVAGTAYFDGVTFSPWVKGNVTNPAFTGSTGSTSWTDIGSITLTFPFSHNLPIRVVVPITTTGFTSETVFFAAPGRVRFSATYGTVVGVCEGTNNGVSIIDIPNGTFATSHGAKTLTLYVQSYTTVPATPTNVVIDINTVTWSF